MDKSRATQTVERFTQADVDELSIQYSSKPKGLGSFNWLKKKVEALKKPGFNPMAPPRKGNLIFFKYNPKYRKTLPWYDEFPLVLLVELKKGGFLGLNIHYLPPTLKKKITMMLANAPKSAKDRLMKPLVPFLASGTQMWKGAWHRYLFSHMKSRVILIPDDEWPMAAALPMARFVKATEAAVHAWVRSEYN